ncbi:Lysine-specific demethylase 3A-B [Frankliniella fusca]|uniref:Lysine-specific demethylase 3A-B n=1 Tax=Frankliniella fusca TaxID=407009 RepID=A0AAE1LE57_9NEOP|nr:Lysine-specific demethylase 3A-B [Frankliniella fusca]
MSSRTQRQPGQVDYKPRQELVGKRFLCVTGALDSLSDDISEWGWRSGFIRAASHLRSDDEDLQPVGHQEFPLPQPWGSALRYATPRQRA